MKVDEVRTVSRVGKALAVTAVGGALCHVAYAAGALVEFLDGLPHSYGFFGERLGPVGLLHVRAIMGVLAFASGIGWAISAFHIRPRRTLPGSLLSLGAVALALTVAALSGWSMFPTYRTPSADTSRARRLSARSPISASRLASRASRWSSTAGSASKAGSTRARRLSEAASGFAGRRPSLQPTRSEARSNSSMVGERSRGSSSPAIARCTSVREARGW